MKPRPALASLAALAAGTLGAAPARAERWLVAETPAAFAISAPQEDVFRPGLLPAVGVYADNGVLALGLRLRAGFLRNGPAPGPGVDDPGVGGLATATAAARVLLGRAWVEGAAGGGVTGRDLVPTVELGAGLALGAGPFAIGPSVRYVRVISRDEAATFGSADLLLAGLDIRFGGGRARVAPRRTYVATRPPAPAPAPAPRVEPDGDRAVELEASCAADAAACSPAAAPGELEEAGRFVLDDRVQFDLNRARVRTAGRATISRIAKLWALHPSWLRVTVEGHACERGPDRFNQWLSQERAARARALLVGAGIPADRVEAVGFGQDRPLDPGHTEEARARNRRVEFVIERVPQAGIAHGGTP